MKLFSYLDTAQTFDETFLNCFFEMNEIGTI